MRVLLVSFILLISCTSSPYGEDATSQLTETAKVPINSSDLIRVSDEEKRAKIDEEVSNTLSRFGDAWNEKNKKVWREILSENAFQQWGQKVFKEIKPGGAHGEVGIFVGEIYELADGGVIVDADVFPVFSRYSWRPFHWVEPKAVVKDFTAFIWLSKTDDEWRIDAFRAAGEDISDVLSKLTNYDDNKCIRPTILPQDSKVCLSRGFSAYNNVTPYHYYEKEIEPNGIAQFPFRGNYEHIISLKLEDNWISRPLLAICSQSALQVWEKEGTLRSCKDKDGNPGATIIQGKDFSQKVKPLNFQMDDEEVQSAVVINKSNTVPLKITISLFYQSAIEDSFSGAYALMLENLSNFIDETFPGIQIDYWAMENCNGGAYYDTRETKEETKKITKIGVCDEFLLTMPLNENSESVIEFVLMHEVAHALLDQSDFPKKKENEATADELGAVLLLLGNTQIGRERVAEAVKFWKQTAEYSVPMDFSVVDDPHPDPIQRARTLEKIYSNPTLYVKQWSSFLSKQMSDEVLRQAVEADNIHGFDIVAKRELEKRMKNKKEIQAE